MNAISIQQFGYVNQSRLMFQFSKKNQKDGPEKLEKGGSDKNKVVEGSGKGEPSEEP